MTKNIEIVTRHIGKLDEAAQRMVIADKNAGQRKWLNDHITWAIRTGHSVAIYPTDAAITWVDRSERPVYENDRPERHARPVRTG